jgi:hypothetical protein
MNEKGSTTKPMIALVILPIEQHVCLLSYLFPLTHLNGAAQLCTAACVQVKVKDWTGGGQKHDAIVIC